MKQCLILLVLLVLVLGSNAQYVYTIKADSVKLTACDSTELIIENHTQGVPGFLFNTGNGRTIFKRGLVRINDSMYLIGADTLKTTAPNFWALTGNAGTGDAVNFVGTTDNAPINFRINNVNAGRIDSVNAQVALGYRAGNWNGGGTSNVAIGHQALQSNQSAENTAVGANALAANTDGFDNVAIGISSMASAPNTFGNTAVGAYSMSGTSSSAGNNTAVGFLTLGSNQNENNTAIGAWCLSSNTTGTNNIGLGYNSLAANDVGSENVSLGTSSMLSNTSGGGNCAIGSRSLQFNLTGGGNVAIGYAAMENSNGANNNIAIGTDALDAEQGHDNIGIGSSVGLEFAGGSNNIFIGNNTFGRDTYGVPGWSYSGSNNTFIGGNIENFPNTSFNNYIILADGVGNRRLNIDGNGNVMFNTTTPLAKNTFTGTGYFTDTLTAKALVLTNGSWPDYVFDSAYRLPPLSSLEKYVKEYHHLPGITPAKEVKSKGIELGSNQAALLKKIEELTLYAIDQQKQLADQKEEINTLKKQMEKLEQFIHAKNP